MFSLFKKAVQIHCDSLTEVENVLTWLRRSDYMSNMGKTSYEIVANTNGPLSAEVKIKSFTVIIPYDIARQVIKPYTIEESFATIKATGYVS